MPHSYEGSRKSVPIDDLLREISGDPTLEKHRSVLGYQMNRRKTAREDILRVHTEPEVTVDFLLNNGCDAQSAKRLLAKCRSMMVDDERENEPLDRLNVVVEVALLKLRQRAAALENRMIGVTGQLTTDLDRVGLKQMKCTALARRIQSSQRLPDGWLQLVDEDGRTYYYCERTGLSSWTLPRDDQGAHHRHHHHQPHARGHLALGDAVPGPPSNALALRSPQASHRSSSSSRQRGRRR